MSEIPPSCDTDPGGKKREKKSFFYRSKKRKNNILEPGLKGFLCFCNFREKDCVREAMNLLNEYADNITSETILKAAANNVSKSEEFEDISDGEEGIEEALSNEIEATKKESQIKMKRFQVVESGAKNILFIRTTIEDTVPVITSLMKEVMITKEQKTRYLIRLVPIEITCKANVEDIKKNITILLDKHLVEPKSFGILFNHRNNDGIDRDELIKEVAMVVNEKNPKCTVNLKDPNLSIIVEVIRGICLLAVIPDYMKLKKFNLHTLSEQNTLIKNDDAV